MNPHPSFFKHLTQVNSPFLAYFKDPTMTPFLLETQGHYFRNLGDALRVAGMQAEMIRDACVLFQTDGKAGDQLTITEVKEITESLMRLKAQLLVGSPWARVDRLGESDFHDVS